MSSDSDTKLIPVPNNRKFVNQMKEGTVKIGVDLNLSCPNIAEMTATLGYDFCMVDFQHSAFNREKLCSMYQAIKLGGAKSITRVEGPQDRYGIQQAFDLGCDGILVPFIRTAQDVRDAVSAAKYPGQDGQEGSRSLYMNLRSHFTAGAGAAGLMAVHHEANANAIVAVQIETKDSIDNLEDILQVPGLDIAFIGPGDLASSMGLLAAKGFEAFSDPTFGAAVGKVVELCNKHGVVPGMWGSTDVKGTVAAGFKFVMVGADMEYMRVAMAKHRDEIAAMLEVQWKPRPTRIDPSDV